MDWWHLAVVCAGGGFGAEGLRRYYRYIPRSKNPKLARLGFDVILTLLIVPPLLAVGLVLTTVWLPPQTSQAFVNWLRLPR